MNRAERRAAARAVRQRARAVAAAGSAAALASAGAGAALVLTESAAHANPVLEVTNLDPNGPGSLKTALADANSTPGQDEIQILVTGTVTLTSNLPRITGDGVHLVGPGSGSFTIDGDDSFQTLGIDIVTSGTVAISGVTVTGSSLVGVYVGSTSVPVTISDVVSTANDSAVCGGGFTLYSNPTTITLTDVVASDNTSICSGAGIWAVNYGDPMTVNVSGSRISGNSSLRPGGGVAVIGTTMTITDSEITDNTVTGPGSDGGGVIDRYFSDLTLDHVTVSGNEAADSGGGVAVFYSDLTVTASTFSQNTAHGRGGGIQANNAAGLTITGSTISGNAADYGGGGLYLTNTGDRTIADSTISGNHALYGGGIFAGVQAPTALLSSTVTANTVAAGGRGAGVIVEGADPQVSAVGSIVAGNGDADDLVADGATVTVLSDHSLLGGFDPASVLISDAGGTRTGVTAGQLALGPLADNGGPTLTHALLPGSIAVDAGPVPVPDFPGNAWDQRGAGYARVAYGRSDVGAYEVQEPEPIPGPDPEPTFTG